MKSNRWLDKIKKRSFWVAIIPAILLMVQAAAALFGYSLNLGEVGDRLLDFINSVFAVLLILGWDWGSDKTER